MEFKKIAILRANALGDFVFTLPALYALRERFPDAEIVFLVKRLYKNFLSQRSLPIDRVMVVPPYPGVGEAEDFEPDQEEVDQFFRKMEKEKFDLAIQIHGGGRNSNPFLKRLGAKVTLGLKTPDAEPLDISVPYVYYQNEILRLLEVVKEVGAQTKNLEPKLEVVDEDLREAAEVLNGVGELKKVVLHPGASDLRRHWPAEKFAKVGDHFAAKGYAVCVTGTSQEKDLVEKVVNNMEQKAENLCGKLTISGLIGLLSKASLVISNDTGPLHLARSIGVPAVGIYWCGNLINAGPMTRKFMRPLVSWQTHCPLCGQDIASDYAFDKRKQNDCKHEASFVAPIEVEGVTQAGEEMLSLRCAL
ncbi:MAG TPA: glycosyltransferase family 9 protein [Balneolaceae bacterium]|nr:glycosyltransferase family 9 protein [Balneolaceae bacterium]